MKPTSLITARPERKRTEFGLEAWLEKTRVRLPLTAVDCRFDVTGEVASVHVDQVFEQNAETALNCLYSFPLPSNAAVYKCEMIVNGRTILAKVQEEKAARALYEEKRAAGHRAALVEVERDNLFTLSLGNVQPKDVVLVRLSYFQTVERLASEVSINIPVCPGIRYIPGEPLTGLLSGKGVVDDTTQVPDASRISPPRIDGAHPDAASVCLAGTVDGSGVEKGTISSPSHVIAVTEDGDSFRVRLAGDEVPDRDLVVQWKERVAAETASAGWLVKRGKESFALVQLRAPKDIDVSTGFEQDVYFVIDRSGSMDGQKWLKACEAVRGFVKELGPTDRVSLTFFETSYRDLDNGLTPVAAVREDERFRNLERIGTAGTTLLLPALTHVLSKAEHLSPAPRRKTIVVITDGQLGNEAEILAQIAPYRESIVVHTFGIDHAVNEAFLRKLARMHRGTATFRTPDSDIVAAIAGLGDRIRRPVITDVTVEGQWQSAGSRLVDLFRGDVAAIPLRCDGKAAKNIVLAGKLPDGSTRKFDIKLKPVANDAVPLLFARSKIESLLDAGADKDAIALSIEHNIVCRGTAFVAWDDSEKVSVAATEMYQPSLATPQVFLRASSLGSGMGMKRSLFAAGDMSMRRLGGDDMLRSFAPDMDAFASAPASSYLGVPIGSSIVRDGGDDSDWPGDPFPVQPDGPSSAADLLADAPIKAALGALEIRATLLGAKIGDVLRLIETWAGADTARQKLVAEFCALAIKGKTASAIIESLREFTAKNQVPNADSAVKKLLAA